MFRIEFVATVCNNALPEPASTQMSRPDLESPGPLFPACDPFPVLQRYHCYPETGTLMPNNQRQHRISHAPKDVLPLRICANYCAPCQPLLRLSPLQENSASCTYLNTPYNLL